MKAHFVAGTIDDLMHEVLEVLVKMEFSVSPTRGKTSELIGCVLELQNPRSRISKSENRGRIFSALGELLWYLSKNNDPEFITHYIKGYSEEVEDGKIYGGYGPRIFNLHGKIDQIENVIKLLTKNPVSRRAVIQIFDGEDIVDAHKEVPCTCTLQFFIRNGCLHMITHMRSNDVIKGLPHDIFAFTMLQEIVARALNVDVGTYKQMVGSLHLYYDDKETATQYLEEGWQSTRNPMNPMPDGNPWPSIQKLLQFEENVRTGKRSDVVGLGLDDYWADLAKMVLIHTLFKKGQLALITKTMAEIVNPIYHPYVQKRLVNLQDKKSNAK